jgi:hypothetical protein
VRLLLRAALAAALAVSLAGCTDGSDPEPAASRVRGPSMELSFTQLIPEEGTEKGLLRVTNTGDDPLAVSSIGLDWPGYGAAFEQPKDVSIEPERTMDLKVTLPPPECESVDEPVVALLSTDHGSVRQKLGRNGQTYVRRLWSTQCFRRQVESTVAIEYGARWRRAGEDARSGIVGTLRLSRREGAQPVRLVAVQGSVLYGLRLPGDRMLAGDEERARLPIQVLPGNRCDEHAIGQATAPFDFRLTLRIGSDPPGGIDLLPPPSGQSAASAMLQRACAA